MLQEPSEVWERIRRNRNHFRVRRLATVHPFLDIQQYRACLLGRHCLARPFLFCVRESSHQGPLFELRWRSKKAGDFSKRKVCPRREEEAKKRETVPSETLTGQPSEAEPTLCETIECSQRLEPSEPGSPLGEYPGLETGCRKMR